MNAQKVQNNIAVLFVCLVRLLYWTQSSCHVVCHKS